MSDTKYYTDIDMDFLENLNNDINLVYDEDAVKQSIVNLVLFSYNIAIRFGEPYLSSRINTLFNRKPGTFTSVLINDEIKNIIENHEPRVTNIEVNSGEYSTKIGGYSIQVRYTIIKNQETVELILPIKLLG